MKIVDRVYPILQRNFVGLTVSHKRTIFGNKDSAFLYLSFKKWLKIRLYGTFLCQKFLQKKCCICLDTLVSGSPILQNGKLIGAVTHVLIDDPTKGFGIFAENMLKTAQSVGNGLRAVPQENNELKEAS